MQWESALAVSTFCRTCGRHLEIAKGKAVAHRVRHGGRAYLRVASEELWTGDLVLAAEESGDTCGIETAGPSRPRTDPNAGATPQKRAPRPPQRTVACFECGQEQEFSPTAASGICCACRAHISLRDVHVRNDSRQKISTRGNVFIHRDAALNGSSLACRNLKVVGSLSGRVDCSGTATFYSDCRLLGTFSCNRLRVNRTARVRFLQPVHAHDAVVAGEVTGDFYCTGHVVIRSTGFLRGELIARSVTVEPGGNLDARFRIGSQERPAHAEPAESLTAVLRTEPARRERTPAFRSEDWLGEGAASPA